MMECSFWRNELFREVGKKDSFLYSLLVYSQLLGHVSGLLCS